MNPMDPMIFTLPRSKEKHEVTGGVPSWQNGNLHFLDPIFFQIFRSFEEREKSKGTE